MTSVQHPAAGIIRQSMQVAAAVMGERVTLKRGDQRKEEVAALRGSTDHVIQQLDHEGGAYLTVRSQDWLILRDDYDFGAGPVVPQRGDQIIAVDGQGMQRVYEVLDAPGLPSFRYDAFEVRLRVHTKQIA